MRRDSLTESLLKDDMHYLGPLSYNVFKLFCWLCVSAAVLLMLVNAASAIDAKTGQQLEKQADILDTVKDFSLPFFLLGNFAVILDNKRGFTRQLLIYCSFILLITAGFELLYYRYFIGALRLTAKQGAEIQEPDYLLLEQAPHGFVCLNVFIDLLLCLLFMFFLSYRPAKYFRNRKIFFFRLLALLPVCYEAASLTVKALSALGRLRVPAYIYPLLTVKPPTAFVMFIVLLAFIKKRKRSLRRLGCTREESEALLKTRRNSWHFSVFTAATMLLIGLIDLLIYTLMKNADPSMSSPVTAVALAVGVGDSTSLILLCPVMLLFSYTRRHRWVSFDMLVPMIGLSILLLTVLEGSLQLFTLLKHNMFGY